MSKVSSSGMKATLSGLAMPSRAQGLAVSAAET